MSLSPPQVALLSVLAAAQEPATQRAAEAQLDAYATGFAGYASLLLSLLQPAAAAAVPAALQTFAALLLKQHLHTHWSEGADNFVAPLVPDAEKQGVRQALLPLLASPARPLRRQIAAAIAAVAEHDFPERWPGLLPDILGVLSQSQAAAAQGAQPSAEMSALLTGSMEVLVSFCEAMTDEQMTSAVPQLFPALLQLCQSKFGIVQQAQAAAAAAAPSAGGSAQGPELSDAQRALLDDCVQFCIYSLQIYQSCCSSLLNINELMNDHAASMKAPKKKGQAAAPAPRDQILAQFLQPSLHQWLSLVASILTLPPAASALQRLHLSISLPLLWGLRLEACKAALCVVEKFDDHLIRLGTPGAQVLAGLVEITIEAATTTWPLYQRKVLNARIDSDDQSAEAGDESGEEEAFDNEGNAINMSSFLFEAFTLLKALLHMRAPRKSVQAKKAAAAGKKKGAAPAAVQADPRQEAWSLLKNLFAGPLLPRLLEVAVQYLQLSSAEVSASLEHIDEFLAYQELDDEGGAGGGHGGGALVGAKVNVRNGAKDLMLDCMLFGGGEEGKEAEDAEAAQLALMGFDIRGDGGAAAKGSSELLDRTLVIRTLCPILTGMLQQSAAMRAARNPHWWKGREVATMLVAYTVHEITTLNAPPKKASQAQQQQVQFDLQGFIRDILIPDLSPQPQQQQAAQGLPPAHVLLRTQALHATKHFAPVFERANESGLVLLALEALVSNMSPATNSDLLVRISSVHAFGDLCTTLQNKALITHGDLLVRALHSICQLVHSAATAPSAAAIAAAAHQGGPEAAKAAALAAEVDESALLKVLETLLMAITVDEKTTIAAEPTLTPLLLQAWSANATKPSISESIVDILENLLALSPSACISIQVAVLPALVQIMQAEQRNVAVTGTVQAALDLLKAVLLSVEAHTRSQAALAAGAGASGAVSPSSPGVSSALPEFLHPLLFSDLLPLTLALLMHTDDHSMLEVGTTVLTAYLRVDCNRVAGAQVTLVMPGAPVGSAPVTVSGLHLLCSMLNQFLNPSLDDKVAHNVGNLIVQFVFSLGAALGEANVKELMKAVVARLHSSHYPPLTESLLLVFARLIHSSGVESILRFLGGMGSIPVLNRVLTRVKKNPNDKYASEVRVDMVPATVDALQYLLTRWMQSQPEIHASYPNKVLYSALIKLLTFMFTPAQAAGGADDASRAALRNLECKGYVIEAAAPAKRASRSATAAGAKHEPEYRAVPLSTKVLMLLLAEWGEYNEKQRALAKKAAKRLARASGQAAAGGGADSEDSDDFDSEDDDDYEDEDDDDDEDDFVAQMVAKDRANKARAGAGGAGSGASPFADASDYPDLGAKGGKKYITLEEMMNSHEEAEEIDAELESEVYPEALTDPLAQVELGPAIQAFLAQFRGASNGACMQEAAQYLSQADRKVLDQALAAPAPVQTTPQKKK